MAAVTGHHTGVQSSKQTKSCCTTGTVGREGSRTGRHCRSSHVSVLRSFSWHQEYLELFKEGPFDAHRGSQIKCMKERLEPDGLVMLFMINRLSAWSNNACQSSPSRSRLLNNESISMSIVLPLISLIIHTFAWGRQVFAHLRFFSSSQGTVSGSGKQNSLIKT